MYTLETFYKSPEWERFRKIVIAERTTPDGFVLDEVTGKPILKQYDLTLHHKIPLTEENVNDASVAFNPENIAIVSHKTHNLIHDRLGMARREVFIVYGPPLAGKTTWVRETKTNNDLVVDLDNIWEAVTGADRYQHPPKLKAVAFRIRDELLDMVRHRYGKWTKAFVVGGYPSIGERERLARELGATLILIETPEEECLRRLEESGGERNKEEWREYIRSWFEKYSPPLGEK